MIVAVGLFFYTLFNIFNAAVMDVTGSNVQAATYGLTSLITQLVVIPSPMITGYLIGGLGIKFAFVLAGVFLLIAGLILAPLRLYRGTQNENSYDLTATYFEQGCAHQLGQSREIDRHGATGGLKGDDSVAHTVEFSLVDEVHQEPEGL